MPSSYGNKYALVLSDMYSRYPCVYPLRDLTVDGVIKSFKTFFSSFGFPDAVLSDQGTQFESHEFQTFLKQFHIRKLKTNAYHPAGNGLCERFNGVLKKSMISYLTEKCDSMHNWTSSLEHVLLDYRTTPHTATRERPFDLFLGFKARGYVPFSKHVNVSSDVAFKARSKLYFDRKCINRRFPVGSRALCKSISGSKFSVRGEEVEIVNQLNVNSVVVKNILSGRVFTCSLERLSPLPSGHPTQSAVKNEDNGTMTYTPLKSSLKSQREPTSHSDGNNPLVLRRSNRVRFPPCRFTVRH